MIDYRQTLGTFNATGHFAGDAIAHHTPNGPIVGHLVCQETEPGEFEWFICVSHSVTAAGLVAYTRESQRPLTDDQLSRITRIDPSMLLLDDSKEPNALM